MTTRKSFKRQAMPKPSLKTRRKRLKQVRKLNLRRISKKRRLTKRSLRTLRSRKRKSPKSKSHKIKRPLKSPNLAQSLLKRKLRKRKRIHNLSQKSLSNHSQKMVKINKIRQLTQNRKPSQSQRKPRRRSSKLNIRNSLSNNRELRKIPTSKPQEIANLPPAIYSEISDLQKQINQHGTQELIKLMNQCIKGNHHQAMPIQRNNLSCKPKEITSKEKQRSENQFLKSKKANQVKLVRQQLSEGPIGSLLSGHK
ncbi:Hypothetical_protein [Hexamita inflata]|uniref:Hypothetical_protein n=1 Tax=Hexamita inflata TaxID=28002 RepID=A0AA86PRK4_9EUKA|nr:Hypothetical protein HINF_LOCUS29798 [Hexamita inflata]